MDPELRDALNHLAADLRGEIRAGDAETRASIDALRSETSAESGRLRAEFADLKGEFGELRGDFEALRVETRTRADENRRHFGVLAEAIRGDIRSLAELVAMSNEAMTKRMDSQDGRVARLEGRVLGLESRVTLLEDDRKPPRPRRRR